MSQSKLLLPNGKLITINQIMKMSMRQVFNHLKALGVAEESQFKEFNQSTYSTKRKRSQTY